MADPKRVISADGTPIAYWCFGQGDPILIVHGMTMSHAVWQPVAERLGREFTACVMDRRGRGESGDNPSHAVEREAEDIVAVVNAIGPAVLFAHSISGPFALEAARTSDAIRALILYESWMTPSSVVNHEDLAAFERLLAQGRDEEAFHYGESPEEIEAQRQRPDYAQRLATVRTIPREFRAWEGYWQEHPVDDPAWRTLDKPVLLIAGELTRDDVGPPAARFAEALPGATVHELAGQGHRAAREGPDAIADVIRSWVKALPPPIS